MSFMLCYFCLARSGTVPGHMSKDKVPTWVCDTCWRERFAKRKETRK